MIEKRRVSSRCQSMRDQATTKSTHQVMGPRRAYPSRQRGNCPPILLMTKRKVIIERRKEREEKMRRTRRVVSSGRSSGSPGDTHTHPFILPAIWTVNDFKPTITTKIFNNLRIITKSLITFQFFYLGSLKSATLERPQTSACMTPCSR